jgi:fumarate reductase subunit C
MTSLRLYVWQRVTALILAPLVLAHLILIFYASAKGLNAASILARTRGSIPWGLFYSVFVLAAAVHGAIGVRNVVAEWAPDALKRSPKLLATVLWGTGVCLTMLGFRAVYAVIIA